MRHRNISTWAFAAGIAGALAAGLGCQPGAQTAVVEVGSLPEAARPKAAGLCGPAGYCWESPLPMWAFYGGVWAAGPNEAYAAGSDGHILHFDGSSWAFEDSGTKAWLGAVWGSSKDNVYAVSTSGNVLHRKGGAWVSEETGTTDSLEAIWGSGSKDVFVVGAKGAAAHFDGREWSLQATGTMASLVAVWGSGPKDVYAVGYEGYKDGSVLLHYDGSEWSEQSAPGKWLCGVWGSGKDAVWVAGADTAGRVAVWRLSSSEWKPERVPRAGEALSLSGAGGKPVLLAALDSARDNMMPFFVRRVFLLEPKGDLWERRDLFDVSTPIGRPAWAISGDASGASFVAGWWGSVARVDATGVTAKTGNDAMGMNLLGVWGTSPKDVVAVGAGGTMLRYDGRAWSLDPAGKGHDFTAIHGSDGALVASGREGLLLLRTKGQWKALETGASEDRWGVWMSGDEIFAAGNKGTMVRCKGGVCGPTATGTKNDLTNVWGKSPTEVYAMGEKGTLLRWDGASWKMHGVPSGAELRAMGPDGQGGILATTWSTTYLLRDGTWTKAAAGGGWSIAQGTDGEVRAVWGGGAAPAGVHVWTGTKWREEDLALGAFDETAARLTAIWSGGGEVFVVGDGGMILHKRP